jgi:large subunit ribosomal protein L18
VRRKVHGTADRPRMSVMVSNRNIYVQFVDDDRGVTMAAFTSRAAGVGKNVAAARTVGQRCAEQALAGGISRVVVDRGGHRFHGRVRALVEAACEQGIRISGASGEEPAPAADTGRNEQEKEEQ